MNEYKREDCIIIGFKNGFRLELGEDALRDDILTLKGVFKKIEKAFIEKSVYALNYTVVDMSDVDYILLSKFS